MEQLNLTAHPVQFHARYPGSSVPLVTVIQVLEQELNNKEQYHIIPVSDQLLHINNKQLRVSIEPNGEIDIAWTLNVSQEN